MEYSWQFLLEQIKEAGGKQFTIRQVFTPARKRKSSFHTILQDEKHSSKYVQYEWATAQPVRNEHHECGLSHWLTKIKDNTLVALSRLLMNHGQMASIHSFSTLIHLLYYLKKSQKKHSRKLRIPSISLGTVESFVTVIGIREQREVERIHQVSDVVSGPQKGC